MKRENSNWQLVWFVVLTVVLMAPVNGFSAEEDASGTRAKIYADMEAALGLVPSFMKNIPDSTLALEWELMKRVQMAPGPIPNKYRELIGVAVSAATKCEYCAYFHTEFARLNGATDAEIEDALHYTKSTTGWSTYINGSQIDLEVFKAEIKAIVDYVREQSASQTAGGKN